MLPFQNRLTKKRDIEAVFRHGNFFSFGDISLKISENKLRETRIGIVVGLKFSKKAIERNRVKRQIREIVHARLSEIRDGFDIILMPKKSEKRRLDRNDLEKSIEEAFKKSNLIK